MNNGERILRFDEEMRKLWKNQSCKNGGRWRFLMLKEIEEDDEMSEGVGDCAWRGVLVPAPHVLT